MYEQGTFHKKHFTLKAMCYVIFFYVMNLLFLLFVDKVVVTHTGRNLTSDPATVSILTLTHTLVVYTLFYLLSHSVNHDKPTFSG